MSPLFQFDGSTSRADLTMQNPTPLDKQSTLLEFNRLYNSAPWQEVSTKE